MMLKIKLRIRIFNHIKIALLGIVLFNLTSCNGPKINYTTEVQLNPSGIAPLTAELTIETDIPCRASIKVNGDSPVEQSFYTTATQIKVPVVGLYPDRENKVIYTLDFEGGQLTDSLVVKTPALPEFFADIEINKLNRQSMEPGMHACDIHYANNGVFRSIPMIFDDQGEVRWYLDLSFHGKMVSPFQRLSDGNILMVGRHTIYEFDMLGRELDKIQIDPNLGMHHDVLELPSGSLLICVGRRDAFIELDGEQILSDSDFLIHYDRQNKRIDGQWDLGELLDVSRDDLNFFRKGDWLHMNGLAFDGSDGSIYISAKNQGIIKIGWNHELKWILSPKKNWEKAGRAGKGFETEPYLLTAIDKDGKPYPESVQIGNTSSPDFDFPWGPHAPELLPNGNLLLFDNGTYRNFNSSENYSRAVEYDIDHEKRTVKQVWQYGKARGEEFYSSIVSDVDYLPGTGNILVTSGYITPTTNHSAKIVEVDKTTNEEVFEATLYLKTLNGNKTVAGWGQTDILYRSERMPLRY